MYKLLASLMFLIPGFTPPQGTGLPPSSRSKASASRASKASRSRAAKSSTAHKATRLTCATRLDSMLTKLKDPEYPNKMNAESTVLTASGAFAEYTHACPPPPRDGSFNPCTPSKKGWAGLFNITGNTSNANSIAGTSFVAAPPEGGKKSLTFFLSKTDGKVRVTWLLDGKKHESNVDSCSGNYWTAATGKSAVAIHLDELKKLPPPPH